MKWVKHWYKNLQNILIDLFIIVQQTIFLHFSDVLHLYNYHVGLIYEFLNLTEIKLKDFFPFYDKLILIRKVSPVCGPMYSRYFYYTYFGKRLELMDAMFLMYLIWPPCFCVSKKTFTKSLNIEAKSKDFI